MSYYKVFLNIIAVSSIVSGPSTIGYFNVYEHQNYHKRPQQAQNPSVGSTFNLIGKNNIHLSKQKAFTQQDINFVKYFANTKFIGTKDGLYYGSTLSQLFKGWDILNMWSGGSYLYLYMSNGNTKELQYTSDNAQSWAKVSGIPNTSVTSVSYMPGIANGDWKVTTANNGVFRSYDGTNFTQEQNFPKNQTFYNIHKVLAGGHVRIFAFSDNGYYFSLDNGIHYTYIYDKDGQITDGFYFNGRVFITSQRLGLQVMDDNYQHLSHTQVPASYVNGYSIINNTLYVYTKSAAWQSTDGTNFQQITVGWQGTSQKVGTTTFIGLYNHVGGGDNHNILVMNTEINNTWDLFYSIDNGQTWISTNTSLAQNSALGYASFNNAFYIANGHDLYQLVTWLAPVYAKLQDAEQIGHIYKTSSKTIVVVNSTYSNQSYQITNLKTNKSYQFNQGFTGDFNLDNPALGQLSAEDTFKITVIDSGGQESAFWFLYDPNSQIDFGQGADAVTWNAGAKTLNIYFSQKYVTKLIEPYWKSHPVNVGFLNWFRKKVVSHPWYNLFSNQTFYNAITKAIGDPSTAKDNKYSNINSELSFPAGGDPSMYAVNMINRIVSVNPQQGIVFHIVLNNANSIANIPALGSHYYDQIIYSQSQFPR